MKHRAGRRPGANETRRDILAAALELFSENGYNGVTMRVIAQKANVDAALIHHFFISKKGVFAAAVKTHSGRRNSSAKCSQNLRITLASGSWLDSGTAQRMTREPMRGHPVGILVRGCRATAAGFCQGSGDRAALAR